MSITLTDASGRLGIDPKTMKARMISLQIVPQISREDGRVRIIEEDEFQRIKAWNKAGKKQGKLPGSSPRILPAKKPEKSQEVTPSISQEIPTISSWQEQRIVQLEQEVAHLRARVATHGALLEHLHAWGRNTAKIIRTLWHRMPDYAPGETPGEFPAVTKDQLDEDGQRTEKLLAELEQENGAWAETLKQLVKKSA